MSIWDRTKDSRFILWSRVSFGLMYRLLRRIPSSLHHVLTVTCDTFITSSASFPAKRLNDNAPQFRLLMSISFFAKAGVNLIASRPQCFLLRDQSIIDTGHPSAFCSRYILSCFVMKFFLRSCVGKSFFNCAKAALVKRPPWVSSSASNVTSFCTGVLTSCQPTRFLAGVAWDSLGFTT